MWESVLYDSKERKSEASSSELAPGGLSDRRREGEDEGGDGGKRKRRNASHSLPLNTHPPIHIHPSNSHMVSVAPRPFTAYQFALLHLLNLLAAHASPAGDHGGEDDDTANPDHTRRAGATGSEVKEDRAEQERTHDDDDDYGDGDDDDDDNCDNDEKPLVLPQELYLNAYCFLTEQIHEVGCVMPPRPA